MTPLNEMRIAMGKKPMGRPVGARSRTNEEIYADRCTLRVPSAIVKRKYVKAKIDEQEEPPAHERLASQLAQMLSRWNRMLAKDCERDPLDRLPA